jgi:3',5'-cyclic AMP phosphodiesterase CpdA
MSARRVRWSVFLVLLLVAGSAWAWWAYDLADYLPPPRSGPFLATPYLQLGENPAPDALTLLWLADDRDARWSVELRSPLEAAWRTLAAPTFKRIALDQLEPHRIYRSVLSGLTPGEPFLYRVSLDGAVVFETKAKSPPAAGKPQRFVAFGDCGSDTSGQRRVAYQTDRLDPDSVLITGDIVYMHGRASQYRRKFFPIYGAANASPGAGAPLLSSRVFIGVPGNHDLMVNNFDENADLMAYYYDWSQPLNGPITDGLARNAPPLKGNAARQRGFLEAAGANFPRMSNFSFDMGDVHWTILDANPYVHWSDPELRAWLAADLAAAKQKPWRFVSFHQPGFHSSKAHSGEQQMRLVADILERGGVSIVFSGHVHNYQRTYPLTFAATTYPDAHAPEPSTPVDGSWTLDKAYDDTTATRPAGVIYLVTGAGGERLYDVAQNDDPVSWKPFTRKFVSDVYSLTVVDVTPEKVTVRQLDSDGIEIDRFAVAR